MAATPQQFLKEAHAILKPLFAKHRSSRSDYKEAVAVRKMPRATEGGRQEFVKFALNAIGTRRVDSEGRIESNRPVRLASQAEAAPARHRPGARSARRWRSLLTVSRTMTRSKP